MVFNPQLQEPQAAPGGGSVVQPVDLGGIANLGRGFVDTLVKNRRDAQRVGGERAFAGVSRDIVNLNQEVNTALSFRDTLVSNAATIDQIRADGRISEDEREVYDRYTADLEKFKRLRDNGALNPRAVKARMLALHGAALESLPADLAPEVNKLFKSASGQGATFSGDEDGLSQLINQRLDNRYGKGNYGPEQFTNFVREQRILSNLDSDTSLGDIRAMDVATSTQSFMTVSTADIRYKMFNTLSTNGFLSNDEIREFDSTVDQLRLNAIDRARRSFLKAQQDERPLTISQQNSIIQQINDNANTLADLPKGKDPKSVIKAYNDTVEEVLRGSTQQISSLNKAFGTSGEGGINTIRLFLKKPDLAKTVSTILGRDVTFGLTGTEALDDLIANSIAETLNPRIPADRTYQKLQASLAKSAIQSGTFAPKPGKEDDPKEQATRKTLLQKLFNGVNIDIEDKGLNPKTSDQVIDLYSSKDVGLNLMQLADAQDRAEVSRELNIATANKINDAALKVVEENYNIEFDPATQQFVSREDLFSPIPPVTSLRRENIGLALAAQIRIADIQAVVDSLNKNISTANTQHLQGIAPKVDDIVNTFNESKQVEVESRQRAEQAEVRSDLAGQLSEGFIREFIAFNRETGLFEINPEIAEQAKNTAIQTRADAINRLASKLSVEEREVIASSVEQQASGRELELRAKQILSGNISRDVN